MTVDTAHWNFKVLSSPLSQPETRVMVDTESYSIDSMSRLVSFLRVIAVLLAWCGAVSCLWLVLLSRKTSVWRLCLCSQNCLWPLLQLFLCCPRKMGGLIELDYTSLRISMFWIIYYSSWPHLPRVLYWNYFNIMYICMRDEAWKI